MCTLSFWTSITTTTTTTTTGELFRSLSRQSIKFFIVTSLLIIASFIRVRFNWRLIWLTICYSNMKWNNRQWMKMRIRKYKTSYAKLKIENIIKFHLNNSEQIIQFIRHNIMQNSYHVSDKKTFLLHEVNKRTTNQNF